MAKLKCGNCGRILGCSCKQRTASDGKRCCTTCLAGYEKQLQSNTDPQVRELRNAQKIIGK